MSAGAIFTVLSNIPWGQVIDNAPKVAEGATRLWNSVGLRGKKEAAASAAPSNEPAAASATPLTQAELLQAQIEALDAEVRQLTQQMQASTELIKTLAEQNAQLVQRIEMNRIRLRQLARTASAIGACLMVAIGYVLLRG